MFIIYVVFETTDNTKRLLLFKICVNMINIYYKLFNKTITN